MKRIRFICAIAFVSLATGCEKDNVWGDGLPEMEHVYYIGFHKTNVYNDALNYEIAADGSARWRINAGAWTNTDEKNVSGHVPLQFHSERIRSYDAVTNFWVSNDAGSNLVAGTDFSVADADGTAIAPSAAGRYSLTWYQTKKGIRSIKIKRLSRATGVLKVNVLDPASGVPDASKPEETTINNATSEYQVRGFSFDFNKVTVTFN